MDLFQLKDWHIVSTLGVIIVSIFKNDIKIMINAYITRHEQKKMLGKHIEILSNSGEWESAQISKYILPIPFIRGGGVVVTHTAEDTAIKEKFSYPNWSAQRIRQKSS